MPPIWPRIQLFGIGLGQLVSIWNFGSSAEACTTSASAAAPANAKMRPNFAIELSPDKGVPYGRPLEANLPAIGHGDNQGKGGEEAEQELADASTVRLRPSGYGSTFSLAKRAKMVDATGIEPVTPPV